MSSPEQVIQEAERRIEEVRWWLFSDDELGEISFSFHRRDDHTDVLERLEGQVHAEQESRKESRKGGAS